MLSKIARGLVPLFATLIAIKANGYFQGFGIPRHEAIIVAACLAACATVLADEIIDGARKHIRFVRKILDKRARFEGDWFLETEPGSRMPYGAISIDYNPDGDVFTYCGGAYDQQGKLASDCSCDNVQFEIPSARIQCVSRTSNKGRQWDPAQVLRMDIF